MSAIRDEFGNNNSSNRDVYNALVCIKKENLGSRGSFEHLLHSLDASHYSSYVRTQENGAAEAVFLVHMDSIALPIRFPNAFLMDCTYKTNKYGMPL
jgi:hypothetical protein